MIAHLYKITNNLTNQYYIGKRRGNEQGRYWGSGLRIKRHIKKYGKENFTYDVLRIDNEDKIFKLERRLITENYINTHKDCLNLAPGGLGGSGLMNKDYMRGDKNPSKRPEVRAKLKEAWKTNPLKEWSKTNNGMKDKTHNENTRMSISEKIKELHRSGFYIGKGRGPDLNPRQRRSA